MPDTDTQDEEGVEVYPAPLKMDREVNAALAELRERAAAAPVDVVTLRERLANPADARPHRDQMTAQTVVLPGPWPFVVTYSVEHGHPCGVVRHMSMSVLRAKRVPSPAAVGMVGYVLGFDDERRDETVMWVEKLSDGRRAVHIAQPVGFSSVAGHA